MIDLTTHRAEQQYLGTLARLWVNLERPMIRQLKPLIGRQYLDAAKLLEQGVDDVVHAVDLQMFRMRSIFRKQYTRVISVSHEEAIKGLESAEDKAEKRAEMDANFQRAMSTYIKEKTAKNVTLVNKTTKNAIQKRITKGIEAGKTHKEIAKDIRKLKGITSNHRATMIARTETHGAFNFATDEAVRGTGMIYTKIWSAVMSARTRPAHLRANRQRRKQDQTFEVWGEHLMYPGDQSGGSAKNVISCRCASTYSRRIAEELMRTPKPIAIIPSLPVIMPTTDKSLATVESEIRYAKIENAAIIDKDGNILLRKSGDRGSVTFTAEEVATFEDAILTHNHPIDVSFSNNDLIMAHNAKLKEIRAITPNKLHTARISKEANIDAIIDEFDNAALYSDAMDRNYDKFMPMAEAGKMTEKEAWRAIKVDTTHDTMQRVADKFPQWVKYERKDISIIKPKKPTQPSFLITNYEDATVELKKYIETIDGKYKDAIFKYTQGNYSEHNRYLRTGKLANPLFDIPDDVLKGYKKEVEAIREVFKDTSIPRYKGTTYRGVGFADEAALDKFVKGISTKKEIEFKGFVSTTKDVDEAYDYARHRGGKRVMLKMEGNEGLAIEKISNFETEREVLFDHNSKFKVSGMEESIDLRRGHKIITILLKQ